MNRPQQGFTLLEVVVAMAILAVALGAIIRAAGESASNVSYLRDKTLATWVAENQIAERLLQAEWPPVTVSDGREEMVGRDWHWEVTVSDTEDEDLRRIDISVAPDEAANDPIVRMTAFRGPGK